MKVSSTTTLLVVSSLCLGNFAAAQDGEAEDPNDVKDYLLCVMQSRTQCGTSPECEWIDGNGCSLDPGYCGFTSQPFCDNFNSCFWHGEECVQSVTANQVVEGGFVVSGLEHSDLDKAGLDHLTTIVSNTFRAGYAIVEADEDGCASVSNCNPNFDFVKTNFIPMSAGEAADLVPESGGETDDSSTHILIKFLITYPDVAAINRMLSLLDGDQNTAISADLKSFFDTLFHTDIAVAAVTAVPSKTFTSLQFMQQFDPALHSTVQFTDALCNAIGLGIGVPCGDEIQIGAPHANPANGRMVVIVRVDTDDSVEILSHFSTRTTLLSAVQAQIALSTDSAITPLLIAKMMADDDDDDDDDDNAGDSTSNANDFMEIMGGATGVAGVGVGVAACATALVALMVQRHRSQHASENAEVGSAPDWSTAAGQRDFDNEPAFANELLKTEFQDELGMPGQIDLEVHSRDKKNFVFLPSHGGSNFDTTTLDEC